MTQRPVVATPEAKEFGESRREEAIIYFKKDSYRVAGVHTGETREETPRGGGERCNCGPNRHYSRG